MGIFQTSYRKARDKLLTKAKKSGSDNDWLNFRHAKNNVNNLIRQTKQAYFKSKFSENRQDSRKLWNLIKFLSGSDNHDCGLQRLVDNDGTTSNKVEIAETLNSFFLKQQNNLNPQSELKNDLRCQPEQAPSPTLYQVSGTLNLPQISKERVVDLLLSVPLHKATGDDGFSAKLLRIAAPAIADSLCKLINYCIGTQTFPTKWKDGKVTTIYKGQGSHDDKNNYRPITVLPLLSKLFEKHICNHLYDFLDKNALRHHLQSRFLKFHSAETALIRLIDQLFFNLDKNRSTGLVFIDYRKAFDLKDHDLLLTKLNASRICGHELDLLRNYLSERKQYVVIDGCRSPQEL